MDVIRSSVFDEWLDNLRDLRAKGKIEAYIRRLSLSGQLVGDWKAIGSGIIEVRFHAGPGYRIYMHMEQETLTVLLAGGDKSRQQADIDMATEVLEAWRSQR